jgi:hypothetical protein
MENESPLSPPPEPDSPTGGPLRLLSFLFGSVLIFGIIFLLKRRETPPPPEPTIAEPASYPAPSLAGKYAGNYSVHAGFTNLFNPDTEVTLWWSQVAAPIRDQRIDTGTNSNIRRVDYSGPESCQACHQEKYDNWRRHAHRLMHTQATPETVVGDFSGQASIRYQGGLGTFYMQGQEYRMKLQRGDRIRTYSVTRTIGSRFFQYYVGRLLDGVAADDPRMRGTEHVLPFGYWMNAKEWVPTVHVYRETDFYDDARDVYTDNEIAPYDSGCSGCHVTQPVGDWLASRAGGKRMSAYAPRSTAIDVAGYLKSEHPDLLPATLPTDQIDESTGTIIREDLAAVPFAEHGVAYGVTCEACHHGSRAHVEASTHETTTVRPSFYPQSPFVHSLDAKGLEAVRNRGDGNVNMICARCHTGGRKPFANGVHTWNSTEFTDGANGFCYTRQPDSASERKTLTCVHCHDPHEGIGQEWKPTQTADSAKCIDCHEQFRNELVLTAHTHHGPDSAGSQCMNCHMPKITEGLEGMVRTHRIFNPTDRDMIESNEPNACNLCHLEKPIDWTISHLREWYGRRHRYDERKLTANYPNRRGSVALGWLRSAHHPTRLVAADFLAREGLSWALPQLMEVLGTDSNIINRQFTQRRIEEKLGLRLKDLGYQFYAPETERQAAIKRIGPQLGGRVSAALPEAR